MPAGECLQGLRAPDAGLLRVPGLDPVTGAEALRPRLGSPLQDSSLPDRLRVGEAVELFARNRPHRGAELLEQFGLPDRRAPFAGLSGGSASGCSWCWRCSAGPSSWSSTS